MNDRPRFSVVIPSLGDPERLEGFLSSLRNQTLPADDFETILVLDGAEGPAELSAALRNLQVKRLPNRGGPGAARNRGADLARGTVLAFTEDDVALDPAWLENAARHLEEQPTTDVLEGTTLKPDGRPVHRTSRDQPRYLPTNLFVRRELFQDVGGYDPRFFDPRTGLYFREDSDLGFRLEKAQANIRRADDVLVTHPDEHETYLSPLRWARRHTMDPLLYRKHPKLFRERIEVYPLGPLNLRRPIARAAVSVVLLVIASVLTGALGAGTIATTAASLAAVALLPLLAKWHWNPLRLPIVVLVPFVLTAALLTGWLRARTLDPDP